MSGSHLVEESPQAAVNATETSAEDSAASLRAAALRTLKSKRRKLTGSSEPTIPPRPVVQQQSIQLDYGPEEPSGAASSIASSPALQPVTSSVPVSEPMEIDAGAREEGEISDSEMSPPPPSVKPQPEPTSPTSAQPPQPVVQMLPPPVPKVEPISPALSKAIAAPAATAAPLVTPDKYYRPGLAMTEAQYLTARDIILDLLGWGVPPEYLVNCGLSREIIFYIFVEYNLRLPSNLDVTGLLPYISSSMPSATANATSPAQPSQTQNVPAQADVPSSLSASAAPFVPGSSSGSSTPSSYLLDIEQQRKQELLARKAVVASLKLKQQKSTSSVESHTADYGTSIASSTTNTAAALPVLTGTVDDFLNSIDSAGLHNDTSKPSGSVAEPRVRSFSVDAMDVDEVPGLSGGFSVTTDYTPLLRPPPTRSATMSSVPSPKSPVVPHSAVSDRSFYAPPAFTNGNGLSYGGNDDDSDAIPGLFQTRSPSVESQVMGSRRGTKRPVAADFVDMDPGPSRVSARAPPKRRSTGFAGLPQRRCVIELSDSEDEREDGVAYTNGLPSRAESRGPQANTPQVSVAPTPRVNSPANSINPTALLEKEEQIRRMREKIAQRQQEKLKKQAATSTSRSTPSIIGAQSIASVAIKQEEDESSTARSLQVSRSSTSATPDPSAAVRRPGDDTEEQSVAAAGLPYETGGSITLLESESSSVPATPIDVSSNVLEHHTTGDKVLTGEAQQEQAAMISEEPSADSDSMEVDVVGTFPETSAQVVDDPDEPMNQQPEQAPVFETYRSLLDRHPLLRARSRPESSPLAPSSSSTSGSSSSTTQTIDIDLKPLKQAAVMKYLSDNTRQVCQYELPGGGECRDKNCDNVHLSRLSAVEPSDEDTAQYLCSSLPGGQRYGVEVFMKALDVARLSHPTMPFDARVQEALSRLGLR